MRALIIIILLSLSSFAQAKNVQIICDDVFYKLVLNTEIVNKVEGPLFAEIYNNKDEKIVEAVFSKLVFFSYDHLPTLGMEIVDDRGVFGIEMSIKDVKKAKSLAELKVGSYDAETNFHTEYIDANGEYHEVYQQGERVPCKVTVTNETI